MHLAFDIFQGIGIAAAVGIRPFLPGLAVGALAAGDVEIHFDHTSYAFLQEAPFLLVMVIGAVLLVVLERGIWASRLRSQPWVSVLVLDLAGARGAVLRGVARPRWLTSPGPDGSAAWSVRRSASPRRVPFLARVRARLDAAAASIGLPVIADGFALLIAVLSVFAPPVGLDGAAGAAVAAVARPRARRAEVRGPANSAVSSPRKLVLVVIDALKPEMLERAIATGRAPALERIREEGVYVNDVVAAFPSVTPVCAATITTGVGPDEHQIPSMNWYHRVEERYVEYGSSFSATRQFGVVRSLTDTVYRMNAEHLSNETPTVFESLDDAGVRTAGTTYLIYRGRHQHEVAQESALARIVTSTLFRRTIDGPQELFYADLYASRKTGCRGQLGMPGVRDQHTGCVGAYLVEHDLFDFLLFSLPDNDAWSHRNGPHAQVTSIAAADRQLERLMHAAGGPERFLEDHAVIVTSDHSQAIVEERIRLDSTRSATFT